MSEVESGSVVEVQERHKIDTNALILWMKENVEGFDGQGTLMQFAGGQSNPTYKFVSTNTSYVVRRKPSGKLLPSAHAVDREFRAISAVYKQGYPVAKPYALCEDDAVLGTMFYVMGVAVKVW